MKIVDLNILLYAVNQDARHHTTVRTWWERALGSEEPVGLTWVVLLGFLRIATSPKIFPRPLSSEQAIARVDAWLTHRNTKVVTETEEHWRILKDLIGETGTAGNLTTDAHLAALALAYGAKLASCDTDFSRFRHLRLENPLDKKTLE